MGHRGAMSAPHDPPELLAPAGDWDCLRAAAANGADAVYFGLQVFNARLRAENFTTADLPEVTRFLHDHGMRAHVTMNTLVFTDELAAAAEQLAALDAAGVDAIIVQDVGLADLAARIAPGLRVHASTQMTITSPEGAEFARGLGVRRIVLARELSLRELKKFPAGVPLEVFVHGALCVAYSGQCLTSEALGQRSANRGECAQACRMPYGLVVDGALADLGDRRYLLSPQDLAALEEIPALVDLGIASFKIEGRLKSAEYVAAVTSVYRKAIDAAVEARAHPPTDDDWYRLEMTFSRGLYSGWMHGVNHQELVPARFGKKRGPLAGRVAGTGRDWVDLADVGVPLRAGDGVVFDTGGDTDHEQGGRLYGIEGSRIFFARGHLDTAAIPVGSRVWKTDDPALEHELRKSFSGRTAGRPTRKRPVRFRAIGRPGANFRLEAESDGCRVEALSRIPCEAARTRPLTDESLAVALSKLGETPFVFGGIETDFSGDIILPVSELNRLRREVVERLLQADERPRRDPLAELDRALGELPTIDSRVGCPNLRALCRTMGQLEAALAWGIGEVMVDFEDIRRYGEAVAACRASSAGPRIFLATPRIQKAGESGFFKLIENARPDGVLVRNVGALSHFAGSPLEKIGDFSLNVANPLSARRFMASGLSRLTISYDLDIAQVLALLRGAPPGWFELTVHQHMPMFHMEHCVFAAFLSSGTDHTNCGRPCDNHRVHLRDRVGMEHPLRADVGCRNTVFNAVPQSGAGFAADLLAAGLRDFRVEFLEEGPGEVPRILSAYRDLLDGRTDGRSVWRDLSARSQLGVTRGTYRPPG